MGGAGNVLLQGIVRQLRESDAQLFAAWGGHAGINDTAVLKKLHKISQTAVRLLKVYTTTEQQV